MSAPDPTRTITIGSRLFDELSAEAAASPRLRKNRNFHTEDTSPCHRLLNAAEPGTYIRPHLHADKDETIVVVRGRLGLVLFDSEGAVVRTHVLEAAGDLLGINLQAGTFHAFVSLAPGTVFFESKAGPYQPLTPEELAPWAPAEGDAAAAEFQARLLERFSY